MTDYKDCSNCRHSKFDELWGEYKCTKRRHKIYILLNSDECKFYSEQKKKKSDKE